MPKQLLAVVLVAVLFSTAIGFALGSVGNPSSADAASTSSQIVTQLKRVNTNLAKLGAKVDTLNSRVGNSNTAPGTMRGLLTIICDYTASISCK
jgi:predicted PurR-regulated permease PerM